MEEDLTAIFGVKKTTFLAADYNAPEQDCLFVEVHEAPTRPYGKDRISCKVKGALVIFSQDESADGTKKRLPFGFFAKRIANAAPEIRQRFFFEQETDVSAKSQGGAATTIQNIHERRVGFTYLFDTQYDPDKGELNALTLSLEMEE